MRVPTSNGHTYQVTSVEVISKDELAQRAPALFAQTGRPKLVLVTCEDYDRDNGPLREQRGSDLQTGALTQLDY